MADTDLERLDETATVEVIVLRDGDVVRRELCESEEQAVIVLEAWVDVDGVTFEVHGLSDRDGSVDNIELDLGRIDEDGYARGSNDDPWTRYG